MAVNIGKWFVKRGWVELRCMKLTNIKLKLRYGALFVTRRRKARLLNCVYFSDKVNLSQRMCL